jgi:hypothetical protein
MSLITAHLGSIQQCSLLLFLRRRRPKVAESLDQPKDCGITISVSSVDEIVPPIIGRAWPADEVSYTLEALSETSTNLAVGHERFVACLVELALLPPES